MTSKKPHSLLVIRWKCFKMTDANLAFAACMCIVERLTGRSGNTKMLNTHVAHRDDAMFFFFADRVGLIVG